jgi:signal transduction histidine kinase
MENTAPQDMVIKRGIEIISSESDRLSEMVEELLDFSRLQAGKFSLRLENTDITRLIYDVCSQMSQRAERQGIALNNCVEGTPFFIEVDPRRIKQVLINLLDNSLKFTPSGGIISIVGKGVASNKDTLYEFIVEDSGSGICQDDIPNITKRFFRGKNADEKSGIGLGLSISNELVKSHDGTMEIQSDIDKGTKVIVKLPQKKS